MRICPSCGKRISEGTFCQDCEPLPELELRDIKLKACSRCGSFFFRNKWLRFDTPLKALTHAVNEVLSGKVTGYQIEITGLPDRIKHGESIIVEVKIVKKKNFYIIPATMNAAYCKDCMKKNSIYYEGVLQLRNVEESVVSFAEDFLMKKKAHVSKKRPVKGGFDLEITSQKQIQTLGRKLQDKYGGILKISPRLFSYDNLTSKDVYRVNVYFEGFGFSAGDAIKIDGKIIQVSKIGEMVYGTILPEGKKTSIKMKGKDFEVLKKYEAPVTKVFPDIEVLSPLDFQSIRAENRRDVSSGEKVKIVIDEGKVYLLQD
jgi:nonsense-mediated mRNA decay protein 3